MIHEISSESAAATVTPFSTNSKTLRRARRVAQPARTKAVEVASIRHASSSFANLGLRWDATVLDRLHTPLTHYHE